MQIFPEKVPRRFYGWITLLLLLVSALLIWDASDHVFRALDGVAIVATILGLLLVLDQLSKLTDASQAAERAANEATANLSYFLRATEVSRLNKLIDEVKQYHRDKKLDCAIMRLQDLRSDIISLMNNPSIRGLLADGLLDSHVQEISILIAGIEKDMQHQSNSMDFVRANKQLDKMSLSFSNLESRIKQEKAPWKTKT